MMNSELCTYSRSDPARTASARGWPAGHVNELTAMWGEPENTASLHPGWVWVLICLLLFPLSSFSFSP